MAVTITIHDLKYPGGELQPRMFPDGDIDDALTVWLSEAMALVTENAPAKHYVYWRGYEAVANRIAATPTAQSTSTGSHSTSWGHNRVSDMRKQAEHHKTEYERITSAATLTQPQAYFGRVSV